MLQVTEILPQTCAAQARLTLPFETRQKSRLRACLDDGTEVALLLPRGTVLRGGDCLRAEGGLVIQVLAAHEDVSTVQTQDALLLARAAYHLGNRHVPLQVGAGWLRYLYDHVLDNLVRELGLVVQRENQPFEPEAGAYAQHSHASTGLLTPLAPRGASHEH